MSRLVEPLPASPLAEPAGVVFAPKGKQEAGDQYLERVAKYIPSEIVAGYVGIMALVEATRSAPDEPLGGLTVSLAFMVFVVGLVATPLYLWRVGKPRRSQRITLWISTVSFVLWAYVLGGPFELLSEKYPAIPYSKLVGAIITSVFTWLIGLFAPVESIQEQADSNADESVE